MLAPVVVFVYNRPEHTRKTIEALSKNRLADKSEVYIFSDGPKNEKSIAQVERVRDYIHSLVNSNVFASLYIEEADSNRGLANSVISGVSQVIKKHGKVIVLEDDLISSPDFLEYMNDGLEYYKDNKKIWSISGYTFNMDIPKDYKRDIYFSYRGCSGGYGTWLDRWEKVDWTVEDFKWFDRDRKQRKKFNRGGLDLANMLENQMAGKIDSWAVRWCYAQSKTDMYTIYPVRSRIKNIGFDGSGTHSGVNTKYDVELDNNGKCLFDNLGFDKRIVKMFKKHFMGNIEYFKLELKRLLIKLHLIKR